MNMYERLDKVKAIFLSVYIWFVDQKNMIKNIYSTYSLGGQYTIYALFMTIMTIIAYTAVYPILDQVIDDAVDDMGTVEGLILRLSPLFILLFILWGGLWYVNPHRQEPQ